MANLRERNIRVDEAAKMGRDKVTDQPSLEQTIDKHGGHVTGQQLGNLGNSEGMAPLTEQEKRNRDLSLPPTDGEAAWRGPGVLTKPSEPKPEKMRDDIGIEDRTRPSASEVRKSAGDIETRPSHP